MNIDKFKHQHLEIHADIAALRTLVKGGIVLNAAKIASRVISMSSAVRLHLAVEDKVLYPALEASGNATVAGLSKQFQAEMESIASAYLAFARRWNTAASVSQKPEEFRADANRVLKLLHMRMCEEDADFYPVVEALAPA